MNKDVEDLLREGMERFARDLRAPAGLTRQTVQRRRRRLVVRSMAGATAALAAGAVAVTAVLVPGETGSRSGSSVVDTAYVVHGVDRALSAAGPGDIAQVKLTTLSAGAPGGATTATTTEEWSYGARWRSVTYSATGRPVYDEGSSSAGYTLVSYLSRAWARQPQPLSASGQPGCPKLRPSLTPSSPGCRFIGLGPLLFGFGLPAVGMVVYSLFASSPPAPVGKDLRAAVSYGNLVMAGRQHIDGVDAIKLTSRPGSPTAETIWVSPGTYLPLRVVFRSGPGQPVLQQTAIVTWLRPTAQNLAMLTVPIPAGFRRVRLADVITPILKRGPDVLCLEPEGPTCRSGISVFGSSTTQPVSQP